MLLDHFWDVDRGGLFTTPDDGEQLVARQKEPVSYTHLTLPTSDLV